MEDIAVYPCIVAHVMTIENGANFGKYGPHNLSIFS